MENLEQLVEISSNSHTEISNLRKKSSRSISVKILPSVCSIITLIEENVKLETDLSSATFRAINNYKDGRKNRIFLSVLRRFWSRNVHIIGAHVRPFHAITSAKQSIQLWVGQRGVWYASWSRYAKEKIYTCYYLTIRIIPLDSFLLEMSTSTTLHIRELKNHDDGLVDDDRKWVTLYCASATSKFRRRGVVDDAKQSRITSSCNPQASAGINPLF